MIGYKKLLSQNVGIDVSKDTLDVVFSTMDMERHIKVKASRKFPNTLQGYKEFTKMAGSQVC